MRTRADLIRLLDSTGIAYETFDAGRSWMVTCPALAARIMGAGIGEENAFWVPPMLSTQGWNNGGNAGGQRTWITPEGGPSGFFFSADGTLLETPRELDPGSYRALPAPAGWKSYRNAFTARSADGTNHEIALVRSMSIEAEAASTGPVLRIRFRHELENAGSASLERKIGLWSLIQLPCDEPGVIFVAGGPALRPYFGNFPHVNAGEAGRVAWFCLTGGGTRFKAGMTPSDFAGTMGFVRRARVPENGRRQLILTAMSWDIDPSAAYLDRASGSGLSARNGDAAQAYCDAGAGDLAFCEIEAHAPAANLAPGEAQVQEVLISIARLQDQDVGAYMSNQLLMEPLPRSALPG